MGNLKAILLVLSLSGARLFAEPAPAPAQSPVPVPTTAPAFNMDKLRAELENPSDLSNNNSKKSNYASMGYKDTLLLTLKVTFYLSLLLGVIYFGMRIIKKSTQGGTSFGRRNGPNIELIETSYVGQHKSVSLIKVLNRILVVGSTEKGMSLLTEFDEQNEVEEIVSRHKESSAALHRGFSTAINGFLEKFSKKDLSSLPKVGEALDAQGTGV